MRFYLLSAVFLPLLSFAETLPAYCKDLTEELLNSEGEEMLKLPKIAGTYANPILGAPIIYRTKSELRSGLVSFIDQDGKVQVISPHADGRVQKEILSTDEISFPLIKNASYLLLDDQGRPHIGLFQNFDFANSNFEMKIDNRENRVGEQNILGPTAKGEELLLKIRSRPDVIRVSIEDFSLKKMKVRHLETDEMIEVELQDIERPFAKKSEKAAAPESLFAQMSSALEEGRLPPEYQYLEFVRDGKRVKAKFVGLTPDQKRPMLEILQDGNFFDLQVFDLIKFTPKESPKDRVVGKIEWIDADKNPPAILVSYYDKKAKRLQTRPLSTDEAESILDDSFQVRSVKDLSADKISSLRPIAKEEVETYRSPFLGLRKDDGIRFYDQETEKYQYAIVKRLQQKSQREDEKLIVELMNTKGQMQVVELTPEQAGSVVKDLMAYKLIDQRRYSQNRISPDWLSNYDQFTRKFPDSEEEFKKLPISQRNELIREGNLILFDFIQELEKAGFKFISFSRFIEQDLMSTVNHKLISSPDGNLIGQLLGNKKVFQEMDVYFSLSDTRARYSAGYFTDEKTVVIDIDSLLHRSQNLSGLRAEVTSNTLSNVILHELNHALTTKRNIAALDASAFDLSDERYIYALFDPREVPDPDRPGKRKTVYKKKRISNLNVKLGPLEKNGKMDDLSDTGYDYHLGAEEAATHLADAKMALASAEKTKVLSEGSISKTVLSDLRKVRKFTESILARTKLLPRDQKKLSEAVSEIGNKLGMPFIEFIVKEPDTKVKVLLPHVGRNPSIEQLLEGAIEYLPRVEREMKELRAKADHLMSKMKQRAAQKANLKD